MLKQFLIGVAASAFVLLADLFVVHWSNNDTPTRTVVVAVVFILVFVFAGRLRDPADAPPPMQQNDGILSNNETKGTFSVDAGEIGSSAGSDILSGNKTGGDMTVKVDTIKS